MQTYSFQKFLPFLSSLYPHLSLSLHDSLVFPTFFHPLLSSLQINNFFSVLEISFFFMLLKKNFEIILVINFQYCFKGEKEMFKNTQIIFLKLKKILVYFLNNKSFHFFPLNFHNFEFHNFFPLIFLYF